MRLLARDVLRSPRTVPQAASASVDMRTLAARASTLAPNSLSLPHSDIRVIGASPTPAVHSPSRSCRSPFLVVQANDDSKPPGRARRGGACLSPPDLVHHFSVRYQSLKVVLVLRIRRWLFICCFLSHILHFAQTERPVRDNRTGHSSNI